MALHSQYTDNAKSRVLQVSDSVDLWEREVQRELETLRVLLKHLQAEECATPLIQKDVVTLFGENW